MKPARIEIPLPASVGGEKRSLLPQGGQITIIGANGAGKSRFMDEMTSLCGDRAYVLSALSSSFPEMEVSEMHGSVDALYREATARQCYMRADAVSQLDKLSYMLFADELESLLDFKESLASVKDNRKSGNHKQEKPRVTRLDKVKRLWQEIFPGSHITRDKGTLMFATTAGDDLIPVNRLSQGEKTALYYASAVLYAMPSAVIFIDSPSLFLHPSITGNFWNAIERLRPDCTFVYNSVDVDFVQSRMSNTCIWVKSYDSTSKAWE
ncbi:MAG: ATP-binding protein, partial [Muribaculaceae bacterium]|nr:ATP-binding protein [Muribaculaceae bacterium]